MDDSLKDLEKELRGLRLRQPSARLVERMERELAAEVPEFVTPAVKASPHRASVGWAAWQWAGMAAAVAFVSVVGVLQFSRSSDATGLNGPLAVAASPAPVPAPRAAVSTDRPSRYQPVAATNVLYDLQDEGYVRGSESADSRQVRARYLDTYMWKDPRNNASVKWSVPRDEVRVIPAVWN